MLAAHKMIISKPKRVGAEFTNLADGDWCHVEIRNTMADWWHSLLAQHVCFGYVSHTLEAISSEHSPAQPQMVCWWVFCR